MPVQPVNRPQPQPASATPRSSARERLLAAADELFYEGGINLVGIDRVIERAGVAKASLYDCFGSKEELIRSYLQARNEIRQARIRDRLSRHATPLDKILSIFELLAGDATRERVHLSRCGCGRFLARRADKLRWQSNSITRFLTPCRLFF